MNIFVETNKEFFTKHPELHGRKLTMDADDKPLRKEYMKMLRAKKKSKSDEGHNTNNTTQKCHHGADNNKKELKKGTPCNAKSLVIKKEEKGYQLSIPGTNLTYKNNQYNDI